MSKHIGRGRRRNPKPRQAIKPAGTPASQRAVDSTPEEAGSSRHLLARLLDTPDLARAVPHIAPETLHRLIRHCGLDVCAEIVASATPTQLASVLDLDLWRSAQPGRNERFDAERFGEWLEVLVDADPAMAARIVAAMDERLVVAGLSRCRSSGCCAREEREKRLPT